MKVEIIDTKIISKLSDGTKVEIKDTVINTMSGIYTKQGDKLINSHEHWYRLNDINGKDIRLFVSK